MKRIKYRTKKLNSEKNKIENILIVSIMNNVFLND